ncbi:hypothetical protein RSC3_00243 [Bacillus paralicheniformis]|nr:hypothetical protein RSC3_00243 [Bacillus paralicheniformis]
MQLSVLDQVPISKGSDAYSALKHSAELAELADQWGTKGIGLPSITAHADLPVPLPKS